MSRVKTGLVVVLMLLVVCSSQALASITDAASLRTFVYSTIGNNLSQLSSSALVNGKTVVWWQPAPGGPIMVDVNNVLVASGDLATVYTELAKYFGISLTTVSDISNPNAPSAFTTEIVFKNFALPTAKTLKDKARDVRKSNQLRTFGANISTEFVDKDNEYNGQIYRLNLGLAYDVNEFSFGVVLPYQHFDYNVLDGDRIGSVLFGQYTIPFGNELSLNFTGNFNYLYNSINIKSGGHETGNMFGAGLSSGIQYSNDSVELGAGATYQYNQDDSGRADDHQHLLKIGASAGKRFGNNQVVSVNGAYTNDVTTYKAKPDDQDYFEVGGDYRMNLSDTWDLNIGYKKTLGLHNYKSDLVYIGTALHF